MQRNAMESVHTRQGETKSGNFDSDLCSHDRVVPETIFRRPAPIAVLTPHLDCSETSDVYAYVFELAGVDRADVDVAITSDLLCVRALRSLDDTASPSGLERYVLLPENIDVEDVAMKYADGLLTVKISKGSERSAAGRVLH
jgi:HSP20 family molecular chaperone IbpA